MTKYLLEAFTFFTIITLSFALPPAVDELIEGLEKSLVARHGPNEKIYSFQLINALYNAETFLTEQAVEDNGQLRIPIYYGASSQDSAAIDSPFVGNPINLLSLRNSLANVPFELPPPAAKNLEPEKPFAHIVVHEYGFGVVCDKAEEEKIVRGVAALAVAYRRNANPEVAAVLNDTSKDSELKEDVVTHRKLVRGLFSNLIGDELKEDSGINKGVMDILADHDCIGHMNSLNYLIDGSFPYGYTYVPFKMSPYRNNYPVNVLPITERIRSSMNFFSWIGNVIVINSPQLKSPLKVSVHTRTSRSPQRRVDSVDMSLLRQRNINVHPEPSQDVLEAVSDPVVRADPAELENESTNQVHRPPSNHPGDASNDSVNASSDQEPSNENDGNSDDGELADDFVNVDNGDAADNEDDSGSEAWSLFSSPESTPFMAASPPSVVPELVGSIFTDRSSSDTSAIGNSPIVRVLPGEPDPYHID